MCPSPAEEQKKHSTDSERGVNVLAVGGSENKAFSLDPNEIAKNYPREKIIKLASAIAHLDDAYTYERELRGRTSPEQEAAIGGRTVLPPVLSATLREYALTDLELRWQRDRAELSKRILGGEDYSKVAQEFPALAVASKQFGVDLSQIPPERREIVGARWANALDMMRAEGSEASYQAIFEISKAMLTPLLSAERAEISEDKKFQYEMEREISFLFSKMPLVELFGDERAAARLKLKESILFSEAVYRGQKRLDNLDGPLGEIWRTSQGSLNLAANLLTLSDKSLKESLPTALGVSAAGILTFFAVAEVAPFVMAGVEALGPVARNGSLLGRIVAPFAREGVRKFAIHCALAGISSGIFNATTPLLVGESPLSDGGVGGFLERWAIGTGALILVGLAGKEAGTFLPKLGHRAAKLLPTPIRNLNLGTTGVVLGSSAVVGGAIAADVGAFTAYNIAVHGLEGGSSNLRLMSRYEAMDPMLGLALLIISGKAVGKFHEPASVPRILELANKYSIKLQSNRFGAPDTVEINLEPVKPPETAGSIKENSGQNIRGSLRGGKKGGAAKRNTDTTPPASPAENGAFIVGPVTLNGAGFTQAETNFLLLEPTLGAAYVVNRGTKGKSSNIVCLITKEHGFLYVFEVTGSGPPRHLGVRGVSSKSTGASGVFRHQWDAVPISKEINVIVDSLGQSPLRGSNQVSIRITEGGGEPKLLPPESNRQQLINSLKAANGLYQRMGKVLIVGERNPRSPTGRFAAIPVGTEAVGVYMGQPGTATRFVVGSKNTGEIEVYGLNMADESLLLYRGRGFSGEPGGDGNQEPIIIGSGGRYSLVITPAPNREDGKGAPLKPWEVAFLHANFDGQQLKVQEFSLDPVTELSNETVFKETLSHWAGGIGTGRPGNFDNYVLGALRAALVKAHSPRGVYADPAFINSRLSLEGLGVQEIVIAGLPQGDAAVAAVVRGTNRTGSREADFYLFSRGATRSWRGELLIPDVIGKGEDGRSFNLRTNEFELRLQFDPHKQSWVFASNAQTETLNGGKRSYHALSVPPEGDTADMLIALSQTIRGRIKGGVNLHFPDRNSFQPSSVHLNPSVRPGLPAPVRTVSVFRGENELGALILTVENNGHLSLRSADQNKGVVGKVTARVELGNPRGATRRGSLDEGVEVIWENDHYRVAATAAPDVAGGITYKLFSKHAGGDVELSMLGIETAKSALTSIALERKGAGAQQMDASHDPLELHRWRLPRGVLELDRNEAAAAFIGGFLAGLNEGAKEWSDSKEKQVQGGLARGGIILIGTTVVGGAAGGVVGLVLPATAGQLGQLGITASGFWIAEKAPDWFEEIAKTVVPPVPRPSKKRANGSSNGITTINIEAARNGKK